MIRTHTFRIPDASISFLTAEQNCYEKTILWLVLISGYLSLQTSCKKEYSCENCLAENQPPVTIAGTDQRIILPQDSVLLDGSASSDADGIIQTWQWSKISGPASFFIVHSTDSVTWVRLLTAGSYSFALTVTDDRGASATDTVNIIVDVAQNTNRPPVAHAGNDTTIVLPVTTFNLNGQLSSDPNNNITGYSWSKVSGPSSFNITHPKEVQTTVMNLLEGVYVFELTVTDAMGLSDTATIRITVRKENNPPPCTNCNIVFVSARDGNNEIYSCDMDGNQLTRLTSDAGSDEHPAWSPDGKQIAFVSNRTGVNDLYIMNADGSNIVRKTFSGNSIQHPAWSPDGTRIVYAAFSNGSLNLWVVGTAANSGPPAPLFGEMGIEWAPDWSPDGKKIAFVSDRKAYDFVNDITAIDADGTNPIMLTGNIFDQYDYHHPRWSPDGSKLALAVLHEMNNLNTPDKSEIAIMNPDGSGITRLIAGAGPWTRTSWTADGQHIVYTVLTGQRQDLAWVSADGTKSGTIITNGWNADVRR